MNPDLVLLAVIVGGFTWAFRFLPIKLRLGGDTTDGPLARFLASTGPAAIATLFVASALPMLATDHLPLILGTLAVLMVWVWRRSVVLATLAGSLAYGVTFGFLL